MAWYKLTHHSHHILPHLKHHKQHKCHDWSRCLMSHNKLTVHLTVQEAKVSVLRPERFHFWKPRQRLLKSSLWEMNFKLGLNTYTPQFSPSSNNWDLKRFQGIYQHSNNLGLGKTRKVLLFIMINMIANEKSTRSILAASRLLARYQTRTLSVYLSFRQLD